MADQLLAYRDRFPTLRRGPYFAAHTLGPMPDTVPAALAAFAAEWATDGVVAWGGWLEQLRATAALLEGLLGAPAGSVVLGPNVSVLAGQRRSTPRRPWSPSPTSPSGPRPCWTRPP